MNGSYDKEIAKLDKLYTGMFSLPDLIGDLDKAAEKHNVDMEFIHKLAAILTWRGTE